MDACCFMFGHSYCPETMFPMVVEAVREHIEKYNCVIFTVGHWGAFDCLATRVVIALKEKYPHIVLERLEPYYHPHKPYHAPDGVDRHFYPPGMEVVPKNLAIVKANEYMLNVCDTIICFVTHSAASNTYKLLQKAKKKTNIHITNLGNMD